MILVACLALLVGFALLIWSADKFVLGASCSARIFGISPLVIGVLIVGFGTSAPEMLVSAIAAQQGQPGLAIGNALGSNIANIGLILGATALFYPLVVRSKIVKRELPVMLLLMAASTLLLLDGSLDRSDGLLLFGCLLALIGWSIFEAKRHRDDQLAAELDAQQPPELTARAAVMWLLIGLVVLVASSRLLVWAATEIAVAFGVSDLIIGLTIVALGTSLPELAASIAAARKGEYDIAIGNVVGSNRFNLLGVMGLPGIIAPGCLAAAVILVDYPVLLLICALMWLLAWYFSLRRGGGICRPEGMFLIGIFFGYLGLLKVL